MGYPGKNHKQYQTPKRPFEKTRIEEESKMVIEYGLRNKREVWKAQSFLRRYRKAARNYLHSCLPGRARNGLMPRRAN